MQYSVRASSQVHSAHPSLTQHNTFIGSTVWVTCITSTAPLRAPPPLFTHSSGVSARLGALQPLRGVKKAGNSSVP